MDGWIILVCNYRRFFLNLLLTSSHTAVTLRRSVAGQRQNNWAADTQVVIPLLCTGWGFNNESLGGCLLWLLMCASLVDFCASIVHALKEPKPCGEEFVFIPELETPSCILKCFIMNEVSCRWAKILNLPPSLSYHPSTSHYFPSSPVFAASLFGLSSLS